MATTPEFGFRYPDGSDNVDIPTGIQELAFDVEDTLSSDYLTKAGGSLTGALTVPYGIDGGIHIGGSGPRDMAGTGSPEGVVTAPVGSTWRDTNATTGAIRWIKTAGSGNTGWKVDYGDTGVRNMAAEGLLNSWAVASLFTLRRVGNMVQLVGGFNKTSATADTVFTLPSGFRPGAQTYAVSTSATDDYADVSLPLTGSFSISRAYMTVAAHYFSVTFLTADAWPSSLPGT